MAKENRTTLKGYFETGDIPNQSQYGDLIDSNLNLSDTNAQVAASEVSASALLSETFISASGDISAKGFVSASGLIVGQSNGSAPYVSASNGNIFVSGTGSFGQIIVNEYNDINLIGDITASGNVSASGYVSCSALVIAGSEIRGIGGDVTASGTIKAAGFVGPLTTTGITSTGPGVFTTLDTGQGATEVHLMDQNVREADAVTFATVNTGQGANELYAMNQDVETTDAVTFATVNTGQGANELYDMDQNVTSTSAVEFTTVNTGQGANELYKMNQDVETDDIVTFEGVVVNSTVNNTSLTPGSSNSTSRYKTQFRVVVAPSLLNSQKSEDFKITNSFVLDSSIVYCNSSAALSVEVHSVSAGVFFFNLHNTNGGGATFSASTIAVNCIIM